MKEIWVEAKEYDGILVSSLGDVVDTKTGLFPSNFIKDGRVQLNLKREGFPCIVQLHRLVASSFFEDDIAGYEINHIDGDRRNNVLMNLEISTNEENREHAYSHGLMRRPIRIANLDTGEVYESAHEAGRKLGYFSGLTVPKMARNSGAIFEKRGYRLKII